MFYLQIIMKSIMLNIHQNKPLIQLVIASVPNTTSATAAKNNSAVITLMVVRRAGFMDFASSFYRFELFDLRLDLVHMRLDRILQRFDGAEQLARLGQCGKRHNDRDIGQLDVIARHDLIRDALRMNVLFYIRNIRRP